MAIVNLGSIKFNWKGAYAGGTAYAVDDVVSYNGSSYVCTAASTGNLPTDTNFWDQMSSAGTNGTDGTDVGTTLTTQGDILYRDGSGLQRLGAGTSGQVLQTGGTGANPSWGTVSSDYVKLSETSVSGNPGQIHFSDIFTSTYNTYKVFISSYFGSSTAQLRFRFTTSGTTQITGGYFQIGNLSYYRWSLADADSDTTTRNHNDSSFSCITENGGTSITNGTSSELTIYNPRESSQYRWVTAQTTVRAPNNYHYTTTWGGYQNTTSDAYGGLMFFPSGGNMSGGTIRIYGIK